MNLPINNIKQIIKNTIIAETQIIELKIPQTEKTALAMEIDIDNKIEVWEIMRNLFSQTQFYPIIVTCWLGKTVNWANDVINGDLFCRFGYQQELVDNSYKNNSIPELMTKIDKINIQDFLHKKTEITPEEFNKKLVFLEQQNQEKNLIDLRYLEWYEPIDQPLALLLLPVENSWEILAYLHWYGAESLGSDTVMAMLRYWHKKYQIELVCHYGTMLQLKAKNKPKTCQEALQLAIEQEIIAPCTTMLPGISLEDHACALLKSDYWFLHERP
jgi:hypothetical protein